MSHRILVIGPPLHAEKVASGLHAAGATVAMCADAQEGVGLARQLAPSVLVVVTHAGHREGRELMATLSLQPATAGLPMVVVSPPVELEAALACFTGGIAALIDYRLPPAALLTRIVGHLGPTPDDPRRAQAIAPGGPATLRRVGRYMQEWQLSGGVQIAGAPDGAGVVRWRDGVFDEAVYGARAGNQAAAALLQERVSHGWRFGAERLAEKAPIASGEQTEDSLDLVVELEEDAPPSPLPPPPGPGGPPPLRVLLVDDDPALLGLYQKTFVAEGWQVTTSAHGQAGYDAALAKRPELIVSDIMMPEVDGWAFLGLVRGDFRLRETPFVLLSCHTDFLSKLKTRDAGAEDYLEKGLRPSQVVDRLKAVIDLRKRMQAWVAPGRQFSGQLAKVGAQFLLRLLGERGVTGRLTVVSRLGTFDVSHERGVITSALLTAGELEEHGRYALQSLLALDDAPFQFTPGPPVKAGFDAPFDSVAEELCQALNTLREASEQEMFAHNDALICERPQLRDLYLSTCSDVIRPIASSLFSGQPPREVLAKSAASPLLIEAVVKDLLRKGLARFAEAQT